MALNLAFDDALSSFISSMSPKDRAAFSASLNVQPSALVAQAIDLDNSHANDSRARRVLALPIIEGLLGGLSGIIDSVAIAVQHHPEISSLVVGGFKFLLELAMRFSAYLTKVTDVLNLVQENLSYVNRYVEDLFPTSTTIRRAAQLVYIDVLGIYVGVRRVFTSKDGNVKKMASFRLFVRTTWQPFEARFADLKVRFDRHTQLLVREAQAVEIDASLQFRQAASLEKRRLVLLWLCNINFCNIHADIMRRRAINTGLWILSIRVFKLWQFSPISALVWCHGSAGTGKTYLAASIIDHLSKLQVAGHTIGFAYIYCAFSDAQNDFTYVASMVQQLLKRLPTVPSSLGKLFDLRYYNNEQLTLEELCQVLIELAQQFTQCFIVFDGLDEHKKDRQWLLYLLRRISDPKTEGLTTVIKVFVTSRKVADIATAFQDYPQIDVSSASGQTADVQAFAENELRSSNNGAFQQSKIFGDFVDNIGKTNPSFLSTRLQLDQAFKETSNTRVVQTLDHKATTLYDFYDTILLEIASKSKEHLDTFALAFKFVLASNGELRIHELSQFVSVALVSRNLPHAGPAGFWRSVNDKLRQINWLLSSYRGLLKIEVNSQRVRFQHYSVVEYLQSDHIRKTPHVACFISEISSNELLGRTCLCFFRMAISDSLGLLTITAGAAGFSDYARVFAGFQGFHYASTHVFLHLRTSEPLSDQAWGDVIDFTDCLHKNGDPIGLTESKSLSRIRLGINLVRYVAPKEFIGSTTAAIFGLPNKVRSLLVNEFECHSTDTIKNAINLWLGLNMIQFTLKAELYDICACIYEQVCSLPPSSPHDLVTDINGEDYRRLLGLRYDEAIRKVLALMWTGSPNRTLKVSLSMAGREILKQVVDGVGALHFATKNQKPMNIRLLVDLGSSRATTLDWQDFLFDHAFRDWKKVHKSLWLYYFTDWQRLVFVKVMYQEHSGSLIPMSASDSGSSPTKPVEQALFDIYKFDIDPLCDRGIYREFYMISWCSWRYRDLSDHDIAEEIDEAGLSVFAWACAGSNDFPSGFLYRGNNTGLRQCTFSQGLQAAIMTNKTSLASSLIDCVEDISNALDHHGWSPLDCALEYKRATIIALMMKNQFDRLKPVQWPSRLDRISDPKEYIYYAPENVLLRADHPVPPLSGSNEVRTRQHKDSQATAHISQFFEGDGIYYFEIIIPAQYRADSFVQVGFCEEFSSYYLVFPRSLWPIGRPEPGRRPHPEVMRRAFRPRCAWRMYPGRGFSFFALQNDGSVIEPFGIHEEYSGLWKSGDVVGAGVDLVRGTAFFTLNRELLGEAVYNVRGKLFPFVWLQSTLHSSGLSENFGSRPFEFDLKSYAKQAIPREPYGGSHIIDDATTIWKNERPILTMQKGGIWESHKISRDSQSEEEISELPA